jgi:hypothetical protein
MIDTERSIDELSRLHVQIMHKSAQAIQEATQTSQKLLLEREEAIARLRTQVASLKASLERSRPVAVAARSVMSVQTISVREKEAAKDSAPVAASLPRTGRWRNAAPYAALVICAACLEIGRARLNGDQDLASLAALAHPAPAIFAANGRAYSKGSPVLSDDDRSQEAVLLVHEWKLPGDEMSLSERLGGQLDLPGARPSWSVERTSERGYRVTFQEGVNTVPYAFEADLDSKIVWPTAETQELLAPRLASLRDAVR